MVVEEIHRDHGFGVENKDRECVLEMGQGCELVCVNTCFVKAGHHLETCENDECKARYLT